MDFEWLFSSLGCQSCQREAGRNEEGLSSSRMYVEKIKVEPLPLAGLHGSSRAPMAPPRDEGLEKARKELTRSVREVETGQQKLRAAMQVWLPGTQMNAPKVPETSPRPVELSGKFCAVHGAVHGAPPSNTQHYY